MRRNRFRSIAFFACVVLGSASTFAACGFPDPFLQDSPSEGGSVLGDSPNAQPDVLTLPDGRVIQPDAPDGVDASPCPTKLNPCDCDEDGFLASACGGPDCDDFDPRRFPDAGFNAAPPVSGKNGDWNCNGSIERNAFVGYDACAAISPLLCNDAGGFVASEPACGSSAQYMKCSFNALSARCDLVFENRPVPCK